MASAATAHSIATAMAHPAKVWAHHSILRSNDIPLELRGKGPRTRLTKAQVATGLHGAEVGGMQRPLLTSVNARIPGTTLYYTRES